MDNTMKKLIGTLNIIIPVNDENYNTIKSDMIAKAGYNDLEEEVTNIQYVDNMYNITLSYYQTFSYITT